MHFRSNIALVVDREWNISALEYFEQIISNFVHVAALLFSITEKHSFIHFISVGSISVCISIVFISDRRSLCGSRNPDLCDNNKKGFIYN